MGSDQFHLPKMDSQTAVGVAMAQGKFSKLLVVFCILHLFVFTYVVVILSGFGILVPDVLITANFGFFGTELAILLVIKIFKIRRENSTCQNSETNS